MGCGCGGSKRQGQGQQAAQTRRDGGSEQTPRPAGNYTWNGPQRPKAA